MNAADWFAKQSFHQHQRFPETPYKAEPYGLSSWSSWDVKQQRWRYFAQDADGVVTETDEIGCPL